jgi:predicted MFS family arabinose efflux permease
MLAGSTEVRPSKSTSSVASDKWVVPFVATLFGMMALQMSSLGFAPLMALIQQAFKMSYSQMGLFTGIYGLLALALSVPAGLTAKHFGEKQVMVAGVVVVALGLIILSRAGSFAGALTGRIVWLTGYRFAFVCVLTAASVTCPPSLRGRSMGILGAMSSLATVIGAPLGSSISRALGWRNGILAFAGAALLGATIVGIFYSGGADRTNEADLHTAQTARADSSKRVSAFKMPVVWALALLTGMSGLPSFSVTFFVASAAKSTFQLDAVSASLIISSGYLAAILLNLVVGYLMDRFNKWVVMGAVMTLMIPPCLGMISHNLLVFRISTASILALGFAATNQVYGLAGDVLRGRQTGNVMGIVSLGAGVCGYVGPQMVGTLRDWTGSFAVGWFAVAGIIALTLVEIVLLGIHSRRVAEAKQ